MRKNLHSLQTPRSFVCMLIVLIAGLAACGNTGNTAGNIGNAGGNNATPQPTSVSTPASTTTTGSASVPLKVTSVDMAVSPDSLSSYACGTNLTVTYTATFHFPASNAGGQVQFQYTTTNGRGTTPASLSVPAGETSATYTFTWSGQLPGDHTQPGLGGVMVTAPNSLTSQLIRPSGQCSTSTPAVFKVTSIGLSANPALTGHACGTAFTESYTTIFHLAPNGPGGTLVFQYTTTNGRGSTPATLHVAAGQTSATFTFTWSGTLPADHTAPGVGIVMLTSPTQLTSPQAVPVGRCS